MKQSNFNTDHFYISKQGKRFGYRLDLFELDKSYNLKCVFMADCWGSTEQLRKEAAL